MHGGAVRACQPDRPLPRRPLVLRRRRPARSRRRRPGRGRQGDRPLRGALAAQPGQRRPAARRRSARSLARARHRLVEGDLSPRRATTSTRRRRRSGTPACRNCSPTGSTSASDDDTERPNDPGYYRRDAEAPPGDSACTGPGRRLRGRDRLRRAADPIRRSRRRTPGSCSPRSPRSRPTWTWGAAWWPPTRPTTCSRTSRTCPRA